MSDAHEPSPEFLDHLEWQLETELRRKGRFEEPRPARGWRGLRVAALVAFSITFGAAGVIAAERIQESGRRDLLLQRVQVRLSAAEDCMQFLEEEATRVDLLVDTGRAHQDEAETARGRVEAVALEGARLRLDLEEIRISGREPSDALSAPRLGGRDFVGERLELELSAAKVRLSRERERAERAQLMVERGVAHHSHFAQAALGVRREELLVAELENRRRLRAEFLAGKIDARDVELAAMREAAVRGFAEAQSRLEHAQQMLERAQALASAGVVSSTELRRAEIEHREAQGELELSRIELALVEEGPGD